MKEKNIKRDYIQNMKISKKMRGICSTRNKASHEISFLQKEENNDIHLVLLMSKEERDTSLLHLHMFNYVLH